MTEGKKEALGIAIAGLLLVGGGTVLRELCCAPQTDTVPTVEYALEAALIDFNPQDAMRLPDDYDPAADWCWDRYLEVMALYMRVEAEADSLNRELYRLRGRLADLERGTP